MLSHHADASQDSTSLAPRSSGKAILVVEDDEGTGAFLELAIQQETQHASILVTSSDQALEAVQHVKPNLLILDYHLPHSTGIDLYDQLHTFDGLENVPALILTTRLEQYLPEIEKRQLFSMCKPFDLDTLLETIENLIA